MEWFNLTIKDILVGSRVAISASLPFFVFIGIFVGVPLLFIWNVWVGLSLVATVALGVGLTLLAWIGADRRNAMEKQSERTSDNSTGGASDRGSGTIVTRL